MATLLFSFVGSCIQKLQEIITEEAIQILGVKKDLKELQKTMKQIQYFLKDADRRSIEDTSVSNWFSELRDAMYDADDVIDMARFKGSNLLGEHPSSSSSSSPRKLIGFNRFPLFSCFSTICVRHGIAVQIRSLNKRIEDLANLGKTFLKFETESVGSNRVSNIRKTSYLMEPNLVEKEIIYANKKLVDLVLAKREKKANKIGIVGTGGVGKKTLAQKLYNDSRVKGHFTLHAWICVSQQYSEVDLLKEILRNIRVQYQDGSVGELQRKLAEAIEEKSFFLVLDDLWQSDIWNNLLRTPLQKASHVTIIVTTRHDPIAKAVGVEHMHRVELMSEEVGWELLWKAMNINDEKEVHNLRYIGKEIVRKCGCLPLAIRVIASVLAMKEITETEWQKILTNDAWSINKLPTELRGALYLSYDQLPHNLKQCFLYCALFPLDKTLNYYNLVRFWVAEGFVEKCENHLMEDTAEEYYFELISRNLLLPDPHYFSPHTCKMHDLLRQLACHLSREECFLGDAQLLKDKNMSKLRRVSVVTDNEVIVFPNLEKEEVGVRTFITYDSKSAMVDHSLFKVLPYVGVLDLGHTNLHHIPDCIGNLIHLRHLDFSVTKITCLPESIGLLKTLQMLILFNCASLHSLPLALTRLCNLRCLNLEYTPIKQVPKGLSSLKFLNDLEGFLVGGDSDKSSKMQDGWNVDELSSLSQLRTLVMVRLERVASCNADPKLVNKRHLKRLWLYCTKREGQPYFEENVGNIEMTFEQIMPPANLENLTINGFFGRRFPTWFGIATHFHSLKLLELINCQSCVYLPPSGQLVNLKYLKIEGLDAVTKIGHEFLGCRAGNISGCSMEVAFPSLEWLIIFDMHNWEEWSFVVEEEAKATETEVGEDEFYVKHKGEASFPHPRMRVLPCLKLLVLDNCPKLSDLPSQLGREATSLKELKLTSMHSLMVVEDLQFLSELLSISSCNNLQRVSNIPQVRELRLGDCPNLSCVDKLDNLQVLLLSEFMKVKNSLWVSELQLQHQQQHDEDLDVSPWDWES